LYRYFAVSQGAYDEAATELFAALDKCEAILSERRYIAGNVFTEADVRLFPTLVRFDEVYVVYFKTNKKCIREYANISNYVRDVYQTAGMRDSVNMWWGAVEQVELCWPVA
jgi:putative glutathione S-transferase